MGAYMNRILALGIVALAVTACGEGGTTAPAAVADTVVAPAVTAAPSTTAAPVAPTTTAPAPTTTLPATTTTVATEDLIKQAVQDYAEAYHQCGLAPATCVPENFTASQGHSRATIRELAVGMAQEGLYFSPDRRGSYAKIEAANLASSTEAVATVCEYDAGAVMGPVGPDGLPTVVNDETLTVWYELHLFLENGVWRVGEQLKTTPAAEVASCSGA